MSMMMSAVTMTNLPATAFILLDPLEILVEIVAGE